MIGYDDDVISETILASEQYSARLTAREYLEKIVQVVYPIHRPEDAQVSQLITRLIAQSGTAEVVAHDDEVELVGEWSHRNPRRIKRLINTLIIQHQALGDSTAKPGLAEAAFELLYGDFVRQREREHEDPARGVEDARDYHLLERLRDSGEVPAQHAARVVEFATRNGLAGMTAPSDLIKQVALQPEIVRRAHDWRFVEIAERVPRGDDLVVVMSRISERLPTSETETIVPSAAVEERIKEALVSSKYAWRTAKGIAADSGLTVDEVLSVISRHPRLSGNRSAATVAALACSSCASPHRRDRPLRPAIRVEVELDGLRPDRAARALDG